MPKRSKLAELRAKTDRQLLALIAIKLDAGFGFAQVVADPDSQNAWASTQEFYSRALDACAEARSLLSVSGVSTPEYHQAQIKLLRLQQLLDELSGRATMRAACF